MCNRDDDVAVLTKVVTTFLYNMRISATLKVLTLTLTLTLTLSPHIGVDHVFLQHEHLRHA